MASAFNYTQVLTASDKIDYSQVPAYSPPPGVTANFINPPNISWQFIAASLPFTAIATICVALKIYTRRFILGFLGKDDAFVVVSLIISWAFAACGIACIPYGYGVDLWNLYVSDVVTFLKIDIGTQMTYFLSTMFVKLSIILMYLRLNPDPTFRRIAYAIGAFDVTYSLLSCGITLFGCIPINGAWDFTIPHTCVDKKAYYYAQANFNIVSDFATLFLPIRMCLKLQLPTRQKWMLGLLFAIGSFASIVSIVRLVTLLPSLHSVNFTMFKVQVGAWAAVELNTGIICACLPCLKPLLKRLFPTLMSSSHHHTKSSHPSSRSPQHFHSQPSLSATFSTKISSSPSSSSTVTKAGKLDSMMSFNFGLRGEDGIQSGSGEGGEEIELKMPARILSSSLGLRGKGADKNKDINLDLDLEAQEAETIKTRIRRWSRSKVVHETEDEIEAEAEGFGDQGRGEERGESRGSESHGESESIRGILSGMSSASVQGGSGRKGEVFEMPTGKGGVMKTVVYDVRFED